MNIEEEELKLLEQKRNVYKAYEEEYQEQIKERLEDKKSEKWREERERTGLKQNHLRIYDGEKFLNIRINDEGTVIGRQHHEYGFDFIKEEI